MEQFASFGGTSSGIAEVRALIDMAFCAGCTLLAIAIDAEGSTDKRRWRDPHMSVSTVRIGTISLGKMQAGRSSLWGQFM